MTDRVPLLSGRLYAPYKIAALVETLGEDGISPKQALAGTGLKHDRMYDPTPSTSIRQFFIACRNAIRLSRNPSVPFRTGNKLHLSSYGMYGYALLCSVTVRDLLNSAVKYHALATPTLAMHWREETGKAVWFYSDLVGDLDPELHRFLLEMQLAQTVTHMKDVAGTGCKPISASTVFAASPHADFYGEYLGCPVSFGAQDNELRYNASFLSRRPQLAHRITAALLTETCDRLLDDLHISAGTAKLVCQALLQTPGSFPGIEQVARNLNLTSRTLRRRLESEGTSFSEISTDVRRSLAVRYLRTTRMSVDAIAQALGFSDGANFRHALRRWTDKAPRDFR